MDPKPYKTLQAPIASYRRLVEAQNRIFNQTNRRVSLTVILEMLLDAYEEKEKQNQHS